MRGLIPMNRPYRISAVGRAWSQSGRFMIYE